MKIIIITLISFYMACTLVYSQPLLDIAAPNNNDSEIIKVQADDAPSDYFKIGNATSLYGFIRFLIGYNEHPFSPYCLALSASTSVANDRFSDDYPLMLFDARIDSSGQETAMNKLLFGWRNYYDMKMVLSAEGNLGIGSTNPQAKIQVAGGDIYIEDVDSGIIMKDSADPSKCYRITIVNGILTSTLLPICP